MTDDQMRNLFVQVKNDLAVHVKDYKEAYGLKDIWFGRKISDTQSKELESRGGVTVEPEAENRYILEMRFADIEGLEQYYRDEKHLEIRREFYKGLDKVIERAQELSRDMKPEVAEVVDKLIEKCVSSRIVVRRDYIDDQKISEIIGDRS